MIFFILILLLPLAFLLTAVIVDAYLDTPFEFGSFSRLAWPFGVLIFFPDYLNTLPRVLGYFEQGFSSAFILTLISQMLWMGSAFAVLLILIAALIEVPLRWYAGNTGLNLSPVLQACRPLVLVAAVALLSRWIPEFFNWSNLLGGR